MATNNAINVPIPSTDISAAGVVTKTNNVSFAASATTDTTSATNISSGTLGAARGGTGVSNNASSTITISGNFGTTLTVSGTTTVTLPTSGTLATTSQLGTLPYTDVAGTSQAAAVNNAYGANNAGLVTITLPAAAAVGQVVQTIGVGAGGWKLAQNASQLVKFGTVSTTTGTGGYLASANQYDNVSVICIIANTTWAVTSAVGNITYV